MGVAAALPQPAHAANQTANLAVSVARPVTLSKVRDLDFGTLAFTTFTGTRAITLTRPGVFTCAANVVCSGTPRTGRFNIQGVNGLVALISVTSTSLTNGTDSIAFAADAPLLVFIFGSGAPGVNFDIGGTITVPGTLVGGVYSGTMNVTADYF